jgi:hypothetical protein
MSGSGAEARRPLSAAAGAAGHDAAAVAVAFDVQRIVRGRVVEDPVDEVGVVGFVETGAALARR